MYQNNEEKLLEKALEGDSSAFNDLYMLLHIPIYNFAYRMVGFKSVAEDITQETFMFLIEHPEKYDQRRGKLKTYLCGVARNKILHHLRRSRNHSEITMDENMVFEEDKKEKSPLMNLLKREFITEVKESLAKLSPLQREVIILREIQEHSYKEIAEIIGENVNTVKVRLYRARKALAKLLAPYMNNKKKSYYAM